MQPACRSFFASCLVVFFANSFLRANSLVDSEGNNLDKSTLSFTSGKELNSVLVATAEISGELKRYHKLILTWDAASDFTESDVTYQDYRLNVTFTSPSGKIFVVPGFFAADGYAKETSSTSGNKWRCNFTPLETGTWSYSASFRTGTMIAASLDLLAGLPVSPIDGDNGTFSIAETDKSGGDLRSKGKLEYVGEHFMRWTNGEYFMKIGSDSPEVLLEYNDIDDYDGANFPRTYANHVGDWNVGDPTWQGGKGKGLIGVLNYLSEKGINSQYFVLHRQNERGSPFSDNPNSYYSYDVSRLDQWEVLFDHMIAKGMNVHLVLSESTNQSFFETDVPSGDALFSDARKIYFREMIARFGYLNAVTWNIGEENGWDRRYLEWTGEEARGLTTEQQLNFTSYIDNLAYYNDFITVHNGHANDTGIYDVLQGNNSITGTSMQGVLKDNKRSKFSTQQYREESAASGKKWVVYYDEAWYRNDMGLANFRKNVLWSALTAGSAGIEHYGTDGLDVQMEDLRFYDTYYSQMRFAYDFYHENNLPFYQMYNQDELVENGWVHGIDGDNYVIYIEEGLAGTTTIKLLGDFEVKWFNPRTGGNLLDGTITNVSAGEAVNIGLPPSDTDLDWVALVRTDPTSGPIAVTEVIVEPTTIELGVGSTFDLRAQVLPSNADNLNVDWTTSDASVVSVDNQGNILAVGVGAAIVTVTTVQGGYTAQTLVSVVDSANFCVASGTILMERYDNVTGYTINDLLNAPDYPVNPTFVQELSELEIPRGAGDEYGARVSGFLCAPETGVYTFWIAGDDRTRLNLSTDDQPINVTTIAYSDQYTAVREWNKLITQKSVEITLQQGQKYYIEALMKEGGGGDHMAVGWRKPSDRSGALPEEIIPGSVLTTSLNIPVTGITVNQSIVDIEVGDSMQLIKEIQPLFASNTNVNWSSLDTSTVTVDSFGNIEGVSPGTSKIVVTTEEGSFSAETTINITMPIIGVSGVNIDMNSVDIDVNESIKLNVEIQPTNAENQAVVWSSDNSSIVSVDTDGNITGESVGTTKIKATTVDGGFVAETIVTVFAVNISVASVTINLTEVEIGVGEQLQIFAEILPNNATDKSIVWSSDDSSIVTIDSEGNLEGISTGITKVRITSNDGNYIAEATITVVEETVQVTSITVSPTETEIFIGEELQIIAEVLPTNASNQSILWSAENETIATVDNEGMVVGIASGSTVIFATTMDGNLIAQTSIKVLENEVVISEITLDFDNIDLQVGETITLIPNLLPENASNPDILWTTDNDSVVTVSEDGIITGLASGTSVVTGTTVNGLTVEVVVNVIAEELLMVYPNPAQDYIIVTGANELIFVSIFTSNGQVLQRVKTLPGGTRINIEHLPHAIYFIGLDSGRKIPFVKR